MAKRFIDTDLFKDPFVRGLEAPLKPLWVYLFCDCNPSGIWNVELDVAKLRCGISSEISDEHIKEQFSSKIMELEDGEKWFIPTFIKIQYNNELKVKNPATKKVIEQLNSYSLLDVIDDEIYCLKQSIFQAPSKPLFDFSKGAKDMDKVKDKEKDKEEETQKKSIPKKPNLDPQKIVDIFNSVCKNLPNVQKLTDSRKKTINARVKDYGLSKIGNVIQKTADSRFLNGDNGNGWNATFDWIMNPTNFIKILEGNYDKKENHGQFSNTIKNQAAEHLAEVIQGNNIEDDDCPY